MIRDYNIPERQSRDDNVERMFMRLYDVLQVEIRLINKHDDILFGCMAIYREFCKRRRGRKKERQEFYYYLQQQQQRFIKDHLYNWLVPQRIFMG